MKMFYAHYMETFSCEEAPPGANLSFSVCSTMADMCSCTVAIIVVVD